MPLYERSVGFASLQALGHTRLRLPCLFMNALLALRPCKAFGRSFQASLPCSLLPLHRPSPFLQPLQNDNNPLSPHNLPNTHYPTLSTTFLPPLLKVRCCRPKKFGRLPEGLHNNPSPRINLPKPHYPPKEHYILSQPNLFRTSLTSPSTRAILLLALVKTN